MPGHKNFMLYDPPRLRKGMKGLSDEDDDLEDKHVGWYDLFFDLCLVTGMLFIIYISHMLVVAHDHHSKSFSLSLSLSHTHTHTQSSQDSPKSSSRRSLLIITRKRNIPDRIYSESARTFTVFS